MDEGVDGGLKGGGVRFGGTVGRWECWFGLAAMNRDISSASRLK